MAAVGLSLAAALGARAAQPADTVPLENAAAVRALPAHVAEQRLPVVVRGVVTAAEPDWAGKYVVQDESAGIFVQNIGPQPEIGDLIEVTGVTGAGWFAPVIQSTQWVRLGAAELPPAKQVSIERLMAGVEANQRIEVTGMVRAVSYVASQKTMVEVSMGGYRVRVYPKLPSQLNPRSLVAAKVRVRGTAATSFNAARRQLTAINLIVPRAEDFIVEEPETHSPFDQPILPLEDIAKFRTSANLSERLHVRGVVTLQRPRLDLFIQDETGGLKVESRQAPQLEPGRAIEAVGFLEIVNYQPVLRDAVVRELGQPLPAIAPARVPLMEVNEGLHGAELITLTGTLLERTVRPVRREEVQFTGSRTSLTVRTAGQLFSAEYESASIESARLNAIPLGSTIEVEGVATLEAGDDGKPKAITLLLPDAGRVRVLTTPSWFTAERLLIGFGGVCVLLAAVSVWSLSVGKKNALLLVLAQEREEARRELQQAHDQLEVRVKERSEQLQLEMSERRASEVEFRAVLSERTRLARELHDTLEQALTGIALQLDAAVKLSERDPEDARLRLDLAREFLRQSQLELRRSIWDLRSRELEQFDMANALEMACRHITASSGIQVDFVTAPNCPRLPETVEESLLRIAQEALTNVVKHSGATRATVRLEFTEQAVSLSISDQGGGLDAGKIAARGNRHFGLMGMQERAKRLNGRLDVSGMPGEGTTVRAIIPLGAEASLLQPEFLT